MRLTHSTNGLVLGLETRTIMAEATDELESKTEPTEEVVNTDEVEDTDAQSDSEDLEALKEKNKRLFERAKKAEAEAKLMKAERQKKEEAAKAQVTKTESSQKQDEFDLEDVAALVQQVSNKEDRDLVKQWARFQKVSLEQALSNPIIQAQLKDSAEKRATANATSTGAVRRGSSKPSGEKLLEDAYKGVLPDEAHIDDLAQARIESKRNK